MLVSVSHTQYFAGKFTQGFLPIIPWFIWYLHYLSACNRDLFKRWLLCFIIGFQKALQTLWETFIIPISTYSWEKFSSRSKCIVRKINLSLWKMPNFFLQNFVIFDMITDLFLVEKWRTLEIASRYNWKNILNLGCQNSIQFGIFQVAWKSKLFGESFPFPFSAKCFDRIFSHLFSKRLNFWSCTLPFLNVMGFRRLKLYQKHIYIFSQMLFSTLVLRCY